MILRHGGLIAAAGAGAPTMQDITIAASSDDADELSGVVTLTGTTLLWNNNRTAGLRFPGVLIPQGAAVTAAVITGKGDGAFTGAHTASIQCHDIDSAPAFTVTTNDITNRVLTTALVSWVVPDFVSGTLYDTPDLSTIVQEVVNRAGWVSGNALAFIFKRTAGTTNRAFDTFDDPAPDPASLHIEWT